MPSWIAARIGIDPHQPQKLYLQAGLLCRLPDCGSLDSLPNLHKAPWQGIATSIGRAVSLDQHNPALEKDDCICRQQRCPDAFLLFHGLFLSAAATKSLIYD